MVFISKLFLAGLLGVAIAHPGHHEEAGLSAYEKRAFRSESRRSLNKCAHALEARGLNDRAEARRRSIAENLRHKKNKRAEIDAPFLKIRDTDTVLNTSHHSPLTGVTATSPDDVFYSDNVTCILAPEGEIGPFWVKGELIRSDLVQQEQGVEVYLDAQFIDTETCEPITDLYWDVWNCNSTGVYSGVQSDSNGNGADASNLNNTALRGIQKTDDEGVAHFHTLFPGHYSGRANHVHVVAHVNATVLPNNTLTGDTVAHIGQLFWDQDLITQVEATYPYNTNNITLTTNAEDRVFTEETEDSTSDPVFEYVLLGDSIEDGLFAWVTVGVNTSASYDTSYAALLTANGGVA